MPHARRLPAPIHEVQRVDETVIGDLWNVGDRQGDLHVGVVGGVDRKGIGELVVVVIRGIERQGQVAEGSGGVVAGAGIAVAGEVLHDEELQKTGGWEALHLDLAIAPFRGLDHLLDGEKLIAELPAAVLIEVIDRVLGHETESILDWDVLLAANGMGGGDGGDTVVVEAGGDMHLEDHCIGRLSHVVGWAVEDLIEVVLVTLEVDGRWRDEGEQVRRIIPEGQVIDAHLIHEIGHHLVLDLHADLADGGDDLKGGLTEDVDLALPHRVDAVAAHRGDDGIALGGEDVLPIGGHQPPLREVRSHLIEGQRSGVVVQGHRPADVQGAAALEDLPGEGPQAQLQGIAVGGLLVHVVQTRHVDIDLTQGREALAHPLGIEVHPIGDAQVQLQQGEAACEKVPQAEPAGELGEVRVEQRDVTEEIEAVNRLDAHLVGRRSERLAVEVGHHEATPIEDGVAVDGDTPLARIAGEETDEVEVVVAHHVDGGLRCLHRDIELITPVLPRD